jgi:hypothetical protein
MIGSLLTRRYPVLPIGQNIEMTPEERRSMYLAAAAILAPNNTDLGSIELSDDRFNIYAPVLPGRRRAYELDDLKEDENLDSMTQHIDMEDNPAMAWISRNQTDFVNEEEARRASAESFNSTELASMIAFMRSQDTKAPSTISMDGVLDAEVEDRIARWEDEEWEQRINSVIIS